jgi:hypothetical protein
MTEQTSFGGLAVADPRSAAPAVDMTDESMGNDRRKLAIVGAIVAVLVVLIAAFFLMKGGGGSAAPAASAVPPASTTGAATTGAAKAAKTVKLPKSYAGVVGRDPFKPLYAAPVDKSAAGGSSSTSTDPTGSGVQGVTIPAGSTGTGKTTTPSGTTGGSTTTVGANFVPVWVALVGVHGTKSATFAVGYSDGKKSTTVNYADIAAPTTSLRTVFAQVFSLLSIQSGTVTVQLGDGTPFDLTKGFAHLHFLG